MSEVTAIQALWVTAGEQCDRGKVREENQDSVRRALIPLGDLFVVADGIGGYQGGATASRMVVEGFKKELASKPASYPADRAFREACTYTNASIHSAATSSDASLQRMGSTVVLALVQVNLPSGPVAWIGHVGDSRAYLIRGGQMMKITSDHSAVQALLNRNLITEEEARNHPDSSVLTRSLGHRPEVEIEINKVPLQAGDALLLCSDGLWGYVQDADIAMVATDSNLGVQTVADTLLNLALAAGGQDNIGIEFVRIQAEAPAILPTAAVSIPNQSHRKQQILAVGLLLFGGCGYLAYLGVHQYRKSLSHQDHSSGATAAARNSSDAGKTHDRDRKEVPKPKSGKPTTDVKPAEDPRNPSVPNPGGSTQAIGEPKRLGVLGEMEGAQERKALIPAEKLFERIKIDEKYASGKCVALRTTRPEVYTNLSLKIADLSRYIPGLEKSEKDVSIHPMEASIEADCGLYDVVLILPAKGALTPAAQAPSSQQTTDAPQSPSPPPHL